MNSGRSTEAFDLLIASKTFSRSEQLKRLLVYLRDVSDMSDSGAWSEMSIGANVFGRPDFNPKLDTIVRVEMRRLRQKLDEFYASEGAALPFRLRLEKSSYKPCLDLNVHANSLANAVSPVELTPASIRPAELSRSELSPNELCPNEPVPARIARDRFWIGWVYGAGMSALVLLGAALIWRSAGDAPVSAGSREVAESPLWSGFQHRNTVVALGSPLFFRSGDGFERDFRMNLPEDLSDGDQFLSRRPASPQWNYWAPFDDVGAAIKLDRFLRDMGSTATVVSARLLSIGGLAGQRTIVVGQPRTAPLLIDLLHDQNFRPPVHTTGEHFAGIVNVDPRPGEPIDMPLGARRASQTYGMAERDESNPDYALVTSIRLANGGEVLSVFGNRSPTEGYLISKLTEPVFVSDLNSRVFGGGNTGYTSAQIVLRVDYNRGAPTGLVYLTHRVRFASSNQPVR
jgi:hypothetical protein